MGKKFEMRILVLVLISSLVVLVQRPKMLAVAETSNEIKITGLVNRPLTFVYSDLLAFPMVSETATLYCPFDHWEVTFNWTGVPLFHLLTLAQVKPEVKSINIRATDGYFLNLKIEQVLKPTTILALKANGTLLSEIEGRKGGFRVVLPCEYGYNWVAKVKEIEAIDHILNVNDDDMPNCSLPLITPPLQVFKTSFEKREFQVDIFTNVSIKEFDFDYIQKEMDFNISVPSGTSGFADFFIPHNLLRGPYSVLIDEEVVEPAEANVANITIIYLTFQEGFYSVKIAGTDFWGVIPEIKIEFNETTHVDETIDFDASKSVDDGRIVSYKWDFGDGVFKNGAVVSHSYAKEGKYQVILSVTDDDGLSNFRVLTVTVEKQLGYIDIIRLASAAITCILALILIILLLKTRHRKEDEMGTLRIENGKFRILFRAGERAAFASRAGVASAT